MGHYFLDRQYARLAKDVNDLFSCRLPSFLSSLVDWVIFVHNNPTRNSELPCVQKSVHSIFTDTKRVKI